MSHINRTTIGKPEQWLIEAAASIGLDFSKFTHETTDDFVSHCLKRHGDPKAHGAATITIADFERISDIVKTPDYAIIGSIRKETLLNTYVKIYSEITYLYFEEVLISRRNRAFRGKTLYKITKPLILDEIIKRVTKNDKTDISKAKILSLKSVQTAGGHPGG